MFQIKHFYLHHSIQMALLEESEGFEKAGIKTEVYFDRVLL